jgi:hypothetical protein
MARMDKMYAKMAKADRQEELLTEIKAKTKDILAKTEARRDKRMEANTNDDRNESTAYQDVMEDSPEKMESNIEENESVEEHQDLECEEPASGDIKDDQNETTAGNEATEKIELDAGMMQSAEEHQDVRSKDVAVMPVKGLRKRRRGRKSTAGRREEPKEIIRGNGGCRSKLAATCRKVSSHATVAWRKRKLFRKSETRGFCASRIGVTVTERRTSRY